jgi:signal transduction histidine kinase
MKLFTKTLVFFIGIIVFQSILTILLITNVTRRANLADARRELEEEASILYDSFNSWKRQIWTSLIGIGNDRSLAGLLASSGGRSFKGDIAATFKEFLLVSKVDYLVLADPRGSKPELIPVTYSTFELADLHRLANEKPHPYIEIRFVGNTLCMIGVTSLYTAGNAGVDLFLLKRIDSEFCGQLVLNRKSQIVFFLGGRYLVGSFPAGPLSWTLDLQALRSAYSERYNERVDSRRFNIAFQRIGKLNGEVQGRELFFGTFLSNDPYNQRILRVSRAVLLVSLAGALLTLILSLFLSRNITHPIALLLAGMDRIKAGAYDTQVSSPGGYEISRLFAGFNEMALELHQGRAAMQEYIRETVLLKEYNEKIINSIRASIAIVNRDLVVEKANNSFLECFGLEGGRVLGRPLAGLGIDIVDETVMQAIKAVLRQEQQSFSEVKRSRSDRIYEIKIYPFYSSGGEFREASGCVFMADDISAKTELEHKIFQAEKLSSISMLSAGMAHEINNPLGSILTNVQNLIDEEGSAERKVSLKWIEQETRRIARIVRELLNFTSMDATQAAGSDVNRVVKETIRLVGYSLARENRINIDARLAAGLPHSMVSTDELEQVTINLIKNSIQAIDGRGRILVSTYMRASEKKILLAIADTGRGIPEQVIPRIFDPFFTTKSNGEGTGLGLSVVYGIITKYGGTISVRSRENTGTRIALGLPALDGMQV